MKSGMPGAADITPSLPGEINNFPRIRIQIALTQDPVHTAIDTPSAEKAPRAFIQERTQRLGMLHDHRLRRDIGQDEFNDGTCAVMQQGDTLFQIDVSMRIVALDSQL
jgi:hypothetical protein